MNKLFGLFLLAIACWVPATAQAAACFWVGGTGNINDTSKWMTASGGGTPCAAAGGWPNSTADTATFDASSGGGTITRNVNWTVGTLTMSAFTGTMGNSGDTATVNLNTFTNSGSGTRTLNLGASTWTCGISGTTACTWSVTGATNLTLNGNTSAVVFNGSLTGLQFALLGTFTYNNLTFAADAVGRAGTQLGGTWTAATVSVAAPNYFSISNAPVATTLTVTGGAIGSFVSFAGSTFGTKTQLTLTNAASCDYCTFRDMQINTSSITATNSINLGNLTNISVTAPSPPGGGGGRIIGG